MVDYASIAVAAFGMLKDAGQITQLGDAATARNVLAFRWKDVKHTFETSDIQIGDVQFLVSAQVVNADGSAGADSAPEVDERFSTGFVIKQVEPVKPAALTMLYYVWARRG